MSLALLPAANMSAERPSASCSHASTQHVSKESTQYFSKAYEHSMP